MPVISPAAAPNSGAGLRLPVLAGMVLGALALSLCCFSPHLWIVFGPPNSATTIWHRGLQFMLQCENPFRTDLVDEGLVWRLAPALAGHWLRLRGAAVFVIPWTGLVFLIGLSARLAWRFTGDLRSTALMTALVGTTSATLAVTGWLGINDAWYAAALLLVACSPQTAVLAAAMLLGPWIDERFILGLPLAVGVHGALFGRGRLRLLLGLLGASVGLYLVLRLANPFGLETGHVSRYLGVSLGKFTAWLPWTGLGWFMGLRAAWLLAFLPLWLAWRDQRTAEVWWLGAGATAPLLCITLLAADTSRAPTMLLPIVFLGLARAVTTWPAGAVRRGLAALLVANLLMPAMLVTYKHADLLNALPIELARLFRG